jgi:hypothetical protein
MSQKQHLTAKFTPTASNALDWWTNKMKEGGYQAFCAEMERAAAEVMGRYGFDDEIMRAFDVDKVFEFKRT